MLLDYFKINSVWDLGPTCAVGSSHSDPFANALPKVGSVLPDVSGGRRLA